MSVLPCTHLYPVYPLIDVPCLFLKIYYYDSLNINLCCHENRLIDLLNVEGRLNDFTVSISGRCSLQVEVI